MLCPKHSWMPSLHLRLERVDGNGTLAEPSCYFLPTYVRLTGGHLQCEPYHFLVRCNKQVAIEQEEYEGCSYANPLVAVHEGMILDERSEKGACLVVKSAVVGL